MKPATAGHRFACPNVTPDPGVTTFAEFMFNLRWPGQYYDKRSGLIDDRFRSLGPRTEWYTQFDPIGLATAGTASAMSMGIRCVAGDFARNRSAVSWLGHQIEFNDKQRQLQKLIDQAQAKGCSVSGEYIKLASMNPPSCPAQ